MKEMKKQDRRASMNQELMTLDFWQDTIIYEDKALPIGTLACDALNVPADTLARMNEQCEKINLLLGILNAGQDASALCPIAREATLAMLDILSETPPFSNMNIPKHRERIEKVFTADNALKYMEFAIKAATNSLQFEEIQNFTDAMMLQRYTAVFGHLAYSLGEYQTAMLDFAEKTDGNEADRTAEGFAKMFGTYFPPEFSITEGNAWMSTLNNSVQYVSVIRPGEKVAKLVKRIHYVSFVGMFRSDLFEGLCVGHAPKKCRICGKWFLTTNARHTKYCGGYAPGDKLHRTCRQIGNLKGREQRELADDHPLKQIYEKRLNTINRYVKRGTLDADLAEAIPYVIFLLPVFAKFCCNILLGKFYPWGWSEERAFPFSNILRNKQIPTVYDIVPIFTAWRAGIAIPEQVMCLLFVVELCFGVILQSKVVDATV